MKQTQITGQQMQPLKIGDMVFIHAPILFFERVSTTTLCWANHVGIVVDVAGSDPIIAESTFPFSRKTCLSAFIRRSAGQRYAIRRISHTFTPREEKKLVVAAETRLGILYDTGFNLHSRKQFCSRFVHEVLFEAVGYTVGKVEVFAELLANNPQVKLTYWRWWYFGRIPWQRKTITPASILLDPALQEIF